MDYSLKSIKKKFKDNGVFYTDIKLAEIMKSYVPDDIKTVYDPTCGNGNLLSVFGDDVEKYGQELDENQAEIASERLVNSVIKSGDTLNNPYFMDVKFDAIVANPPFSVKWEQVSDERFNFTSLAPKSKADYAFILHCLHLLSDKGIAVILNFPGILYRGNSEGKIREYILRQNYIDKVIRIPSGFFEDTKIETALLVLRKNKQNTDVVFIDKVLEIERVVSFDEIKSNDFTLSVNTYIAKDVEKEQVDTKELMSGARKSFIKRLKAEIEFDKMVCENDNFCFDVFLDEIENVVKSYR